MFVLAHLSDPHLAPVPAPRVAELLNKRAIGYINWRRERAAIHRADVLDALVRDLKARAYNHLAVTGDLVNIALPAEYPPGRAWLDHLGPPDTVTFVPGNHDAYVSAGLSLARRHLAPFMQGDGFESFPFVRRRGSIAMIGLSSAVATPPFMATGTLGGEQLKQLATRLADLEREGLFRVVLIHHPLFSKPSRYYKRLTDAEELRGVLQKHGAELVIHGHDHVRSSIKTDGPRGSIPVIGVPSASGARDGKHEPASYNLYEIDGQAGAWRCTAIARGLADDGTMMELKRETLLR